VFTVPSSDISKMEKPLDQEIQEILAEHSIKFPTEELNDFTRLERLAILVKGFRAVNLIDAFLIFIVLSILIDSSFRIDFLSLVATAAMGYSAWRFKNYALAATKLKRLYLRA
jgi:uncharacterized membrane protein